MLQRFRRLKYLYLQNVANAALIILACCCLHNICISLNDVLAEDEQLLLANIDGPDNGNDGDLERHDDQFPALMKRNVIAQQLYENRRR